MKRRSARIADRVQASGGQPGDDDSSDESSENNDEGGDDGGYEGDDTDPPASPRRNKGKQRATRRGPSDDVIAESDELRTMQAKFKSVKDQFDVVKNPALYYADKMRRLMQDSKLLRIVAPYQRAEPAKLLQDFLQNPPLRGSSSWRWAMGEPSHQRADATTLRFVRGTKTSQDFKILRGGIATEIIPKDDPDAEEDIATIGDTTVDLLNRLPVMDFQQGNLDEIFRVVAHAVLDKPLLLPLPYLNNEDVVPIIRYYDPDSGQVVTSRKLRIRYDWFSDISIDDIPDVESSCRWTQAGGYIGAARTIVNQATKADGTLYTPATIPANVLAKFGDNAYKAEKWARFVICHLNGRAVSEHGLADMVHNLEDEHGIPSRRYRGSYGGKQLFGSVVLSDTRAIRYYFNSWPSRDVSGILEEQIIAVVRTLDGILASTPLEVGKNHFIASGDVRVAALYLAEAADIINEQIFDQQFDFAGCSCDGPMSQVKTHYCQCCLRDRLCRTLELVGNARICKRCESKTAETSTSDVVESVMSRSVRKNHRRECQALKKDVEHRNEKKRVDDMLDALKANYREGNRWHDDYTSQEREMAGTTGVRVHRDPFVPSVEAVEPYAMSHDGTMRVHTVENVAMTTSGFNFIKQRQILGFLVELAKFDPSRSHTPAEKEEFRQICDRLYLVNIKTPYTKKARTQGRGLDDLAADQAEWRSGRPAEGERGPWENILHRWAPDSAPQPGACLWDDETCERLGALSDEIQEHYGVRLQKAPDGAPWIAPEGGERCPAGWGWSALSIIMTLREKRMRTVCNRHWLSKLTGSSQIVIC
jgi:hypothetical protein